MPHAALVCNASILRASQIRTSIDHAASGKAANDPVAHLKTSGVVHTSGSSSRRAHMAMAANWLAKADAPYAAAAGVAYQWWPACKAKQLS
eukprot:365847-Chlamydomonas_euryale.AAC.18